METRITRLCLLDKRRLRVASRVSDVDDERYPSVVNNGLHIKRDGVSMSWAAASAVVSSRTRPRSMALMILSCNVNEGLVSLIPPMFIDRSA